MDVNQAEYSVELLISLAVIIRLSCRTVPAAQSYQPFLRKAFICPAFFTRSGQIRLISKPGPHFAQAMLKAVSTSAHHSHLPAASEVRQRSCCQLCWVPLQTDTYCKEGARREDPAKELGLERLKVQALPSATVLLCLSGQHVWVTFTALSRT